MKNLQKSVALEGKNLQLGYSQKLRKEILSGLNFHLKAGEFTCLLGPNGVGKSTLIKAVLGQIKPWNGEILLHQKKLENYSPEDLSKEISVVLTDPVFPGNMTVGQLVALGRTPHTGWSGKLSTEDREIVEKALSDTKIQYLREERLSEISDGQRQKAMIARALAQDGLVMILDEPTAHLDLINRFEIMQLLSEIAKKQNKAILVVTHDLEISIETADTFWILNCGSPLVSGSPEDLILSGQINGLLPSGTYQFNLERGRIERTLSEQTYPILGPKEQTYWLTKALRKAGITQLPEQVELDASPFTIKTSNGNFERIEDWIQSLKS